MSRFINMMFIIIVYKGLQCLKLSKTLVRRDRKRNRLVMATFKTKLTEMCGIQHPIIQGGMHYVGYAEMAAGKCVAY